MNRIETWLKQWQCHDLRQSVIEEIHDYSTEQIRQLLRESDFAVSGTRTTLIRRVARILSQRERKKGKTFVKGGGKSIYIPIALLPEIESRLKDYYES